MSRRPHRILLHCATLAVIMVLMACGDDATGPEPELPPDNVTLPEGILNGAQFQQAVRSAFPEYQWPPGYTTTADSILERFSGGEWPPGAGYKDGLEHTVIGVWHQCAWYMAWLDAFQSGDSTAQAEALYVMTDVIPNHPSVGAGGQEHLTGIAEAAALGDPSRVTQYVENGVCQDMSFDGAPQNTTRITDASIATVWPDSTSMAAARSATAAFTRSVSR